MPTPRPPKSMPHYSPSEHEVAMVNAAFSAKESTGSNSGSNLSELAPR